VRSEMKGFVFKSRFTPGLKNATDVRLRKGDKVTYQNLSGATETAVIDSELMQHESGPYGYEAVFDGDGKRGFAVEERIVGWDGKDVVI
jgi:hypothetical protein